MSNEIQKDDITLAGGFMPVMINGNLNYIKTIEANNKEGFTTLTLSQKIDPFLMRDHFDGKTEDAQFEVIEPKQIENKKT